MVDFDEETLNREDRAEENKARRANNFKKMGEKVKGWRTWISGRSDRRKNRELQKLMLEKEKLALERGKMEMAALSRERRERLRGEIREKGFWPNLGMGLLLGALIGALLFGVLSGFNLQGVIMGMLIGAAIGGVLGMLATIPLARKIIGFLLVVAAILFVILLVYFGIQYGRTGLLPAFFKPYEPTLTWAFASIGEKLACILPQNFEKCFIEPYSGWGKETEAETISITTEFLTSSMFFEGKDEEIEAKITVLNDPEKSTRFELEPQCYIKTESGYDKIGTLGTGLDFAAAKEPQIGSVTCTIPSGYMQSYGETKDRIEVMVRLDKPVFGTVEWNLWSLSATDKETLMAEGESIPKIGERIGEQRVFGLSPYSFGIGVRKSLPLSGGEYDLYVELKKEAAGIGKLKKIDQIKVEDIKADTVSIQSCEGMSKELGSYVAKAVTDPVEIEKIEIEGGKKYTCKIEVNPQNTPTGESIVAQSVPLRAEIKYWVEYEQSSIILIR